jgi:hypothetical protein
MVGALLPQRLLLVPKGHEILAFLAFFGICIGIVQLSFTTAERKLRLPATRNFPGAPRVYAGLLAGIALLPDFDGSGRTGLCLIRSTATAVGRARMANIGCAGVLEFHFLGMDHLRRLLRQHPRRLSGGANLIEIYLDPHSIYTQCAESPHVTLPYKLRTAVETVASFEGHTSGARALL